MSKGVIQILYGKKLYRCIEDEQEKDNLQKQYGGHTVYKIPVSRFVPEKLHAKNTSDAAADKSYDKKYRFGDAPQMLYCFAFVNAH